MKFSAFSRQFSARLAARQVFGQLILVVIIWLLIAEGWLLPPPAYAVTKSFWSESLTNNIVYNPYQGLGVCHWLSPTILSDPIVSWAYDASNEGVFWTNVEPQENQFNWTGMDSLVNLAQSKGKKIWLQVYNAQGYVPQWALNKTVNGQKMVIMGGATSDCNAMEANIPLPWDEVYLGLWQKVIHEMAQRYDNNPTVEAIIIMAGGGYGEMVVCSTCGSKGCWAKVSGCSQSSSNSGCENNPTCVQCVDTKFADAVKGLIDLYLSEFQNKPIVLQLGNGLNFTTHSSSAVIKPVLDYAIPKYGLRVLLKTNGWHCGSCEGNVCDNGHGGIAQNYYTNFGAGDLTKFGLEPRGKPNDNENASAGGYAVPDFNSMINCRNKISYACLQDAYWEGTRLQSFSPGRESLARDIGAKVGLREVTYPDSVTAGQTYPFSVKVKNLGDVPPFRPKREINGGTPKDKAASYQLTFQLIKDNQIDFHYELDLNPGSNTWTNNQENTFSANIPIPAAINNGSHELRVALFDPEGKQKFRQEYFRFLNRDILDAEGRAKIGTVSVSGGTGTTSSPTPTPSPTSNPLTPSPTLPPPSPTLPPSNSSLNLKAGFQGAFTNQSLLGKVVAQGTNFIAHAILINQQVLQNLALGGLNPNQNYDFALSSIPFLGNRKSLTLKQGANPGTAGVLDFGALRTGDLNGDGQINGLDWSLMKLNYGQSGEE